MSFFARFFALYMRLFSRVVWVVALVLMVGFLIAAISIALFGGQAMDPALRWGLVAVTLVVSILSYYLAQAARDKF